MAHFRGFVVCTDDMAAGVASSLARCAQFAEVGRQGVEVVFLCSARDTPELGGQRAAIVGIDDRSTQFVVEDPLPTENCKLRIDVTSWLVVPRDRADPSAWTPFAKSLWQRLGAPDGEDEEADDGAVTGYRFETSCDHCDIGKIKVLSRQLSALADQFDKEHVPYYMSYFMDGYSETRSDPDDEFECDVFSPAILVTANWTDPSTGEAREICINDGGDVEMSFEDDALDVGFLWE